MSKHDKKAAALGRVRAEHVRHVLEADVSEAGPNRKRFVCLGLSGRYSLGHGSDNSAVRTAYGRQFPKKRAL